MGFQAPNRAAMERQMSQAAENARLAIEAFYEQVEDLKVDISDSGNIVDLAGAITFAEDVLGIPAGTELGQSTAWATTMVDANTVAAALTTALAGQLERIRRIVFKER